MRRSNFVFWIPGLFIFASCGGDDGTWSSAEHRTEGKNQHVAGLTDDCPSFVYLGNDPGNDDSPDWSEAAQGVAHDGQHWFFTNVTHLRKYEKNWKGIEDEPDLGLISVVGLPSELEHLGIDHFGDIDALGGYVFVPFEGTIATGVSLGPDGIPIIETEPTAVIAAYRTSDLSLADWIEVTSIQPKAGWLAIAPIDHVLFTSANALVAGTPLLRYRLELSAIGRDDAEFLVPLAPVEVQDFDGQPIEGKFTYLQGGTFTPWGDLFLSVGTGSDDPEDVRGGLHLFRPNHENTAYRLIQSSRNVNDPPGSPTFAYKYDPTDAWYNPLELIDYFEEPEGLDWWNQDDDPNSTYHGQLHAILLSDWPTDDEIWFKHYEVKYDCVMDADTDGDGLTDGEEAYSLNSSPLVADSDRDGVPDEEDNCPGVGQPDQADVDGDGKGDVCDEDLDGDGQSNADELACGSNPRAADSLSPDFDGDNWPDCADTDDDDDAVPDESDRCPGTRIPDPSIPSSGVLSVNRFSPIDSDLIFDTNWRGKAAPGPFSTSQTGGCNAVQIADALGLGRSHYESGLSYGVLKEWMER